MNITILEEKKNRLRFRIAGQQNTLANILSLSLQQDEQVKNVGFGIEHPLIGNPSFTIETSGEDPKKAVSSAVKRLDKELAKLRADASKLPK